MCLTDIKTTYSLSIHHYHRFNLTEIIDYPNPLKSTGYLMHQQV